MMAEVIIRYELGDFDVEKRVKQIKKEYAELFSKEQLAERSY